MSPRSLLAASVWMLGLILVASETVGATEPPIQIVLITIDTLRADRLGCYGYDPDTSPHMDALAADSVLFLDATCQAPATEFSIRSFLTGTASSEATTANRMANPELSPLPEVLRKAGLRTIGVVANPKVRAEMGFARGFDRYIEVYREEIREQLGDVEREAPASFPGAMQPEPGSKVVANEVTASVLPLLPELAKQSFFLWILYLDPHTPYMQHDHRFYRDPPTRQAGTGTTTEVNSGTRHPLGRPVRGKAIPGRFTRTRGTEQHRSLVNRLYDGEVRYVDHELGRLLQALEDAKIYHRALIVLTADHGESLYDHESYYGHGNLPYEPTARVPLMIRWPDGEPGRVEEPVALVDLYPTLLRHAGREPPHPVRGAVLTRGGRSSSPAILLETTYWSTDRVLRQGPYKLVQWGKSRGRAVSLFDLSRDPLETRDIARDDEKRTQAMIRRLNETIGTLRIPRFAPPTPEPDPEMLEQLKALGYVE